MVRFVLYTFKEISEYHSIMTSEEHWEQAYMSCKTRLAAFATTT